ncbi:MBL fold metallo-hydrolase [Sporosarcina sp. NCCP-2222]|uniref:MBL fold metallo-hydrolase n=1 Tax=Sporosarcina sp. NCCP-2222 TaxID=2935073 RepID=UPI002084E992|nr:MBL fold metallo-hydrolase [Sporosarcina sp. NCCP-2222]GKV57962.1 MBL fold metallo-hydrolase [Sporosarcina sp. NCCP-2222]
MERSSSTERFQPLTSISSGDGLEVTPDLYCLTIQIVNVVFYGHAGEGNDWVLIDAGMPKSADAIREAAEDRFGENNPPKAIILTHGHFDHIGGLIDLLEVWNVPVYAHPLEIPYLTGRKDYPKPDVSVEGGMVAKLSFMFPHEGIDLGPSVHPLANDHTVPFMPEWKWIHTPGHSEGHISLFRAADHAMIVGDAFVTVRQDALYKVITQEKEVSGPPRYLTTDWEKSEQSVDILQALDPHIAITGHGLPANGSWLRENLTKLATDFRQLAVPDHGKFVEDDQ